MTSDSRPPSYGRVARSVPPLAPETEDEVRRMREAEIRRAHRLGMQVAWRGPDRPNPDPDAIRLVYVDREPTDELVAAIEDHALGE